VQSRCPSSLFIESSASRSVRRARSILTYLPTQTDLSRTTAPSDPRTRRLVITAILLNLSLIFVKMTDLGPLTTIFNVPSTCTSVITSFSGALFIGHFVSVDLRCYPPGASSLTTQWFSSYYWSPGVCPLSWTTACSYTEVQFAAADTASLCCPL
jgi:hypothetical protein